MDSRPEKLVLCSAGSMSIRPNLAGTALHQLSSLYIQESLQSITSLPHAKNSFISDCQNLSNLRLLGVHELAILLSLRHDM